MLVKGNPSNRTPSIMDSPTLARVERARLRLEASQMDKRQDSLERSILDPKYSFLSGKIAIESISGPIKRGLMWQQRDRLFSRWKERYFVLTRDYLHCFKRASGSASERISDMGQFIFKIKLVDVEKVEWLNRRSYSVVGLALGREGRVLLRTENDLEDWFELLDECTRCSKERRQALRDLQGPRSRASLAAPPSHSSLQTNHMGLGGTYSSALEDWLLNRHKTSTFDTHFTMSDSVPDLTGFNDSSGMSTNRSTQSHALPFNVNIKTKYTTNSNGYALSKQNNAFHGTPQRQYLQPVNGHPGNNYVVDEDGNSIQLRRSGGDGSYGRQMDNGNSYVDNDEWLYRRPPGPNEIRHSLLTDIDISACDSGLGTPSSTTQRPSSCRDVYRPHGQNGVRDSTDTGVSSSRGTLHASPGGSFRTNGNINGLSRHSVQDRVLRNCNEKDHHPSNRLMANKPNANETCDSNRNQLNNVMHRHQICSDNGQMRRQYQPLPVLTNIIKDDQAMKFRDRSFSDAQPPPQQQQHRHVPNHHISPSPRRRILIGTSTRV